jgi:outer membrane biosynthesis protein TonB
MTSTRATCEYSCCTRAGDGSINAQDGHHSRHFNRIKPRVSRLHRDRVIIGRGWLEFAQTLRRPAPMNWAARKICCHPIPSLPLTLEIAWYCAKKSCSECWHRLRLKRAALFSLSPAPQQQALFSTCALKRFFLPLLVSCLLHAALIFPIYVDSGTGSTKSGQRGGVPLVLTKVRIVQSVPVAKKSTVDLIAAKSIQIQSAQQPQTPTRQIDPPLPDPPPLTTKQSPDAGPPQLPTNYYTRAELTKGPQVRTNPELEPPEVKHIVATGTLSLKVWINELGEVDKVAIDQTDLPEAIAAVAEDAFRKLRFEPAEINGRNVASVIQIEIRYDDDRLVTPEF